MTGALPVRLTAMDDPPAVEWVWWDGARHTEPFFQETVARLRFTNPANRGGRNPRSPLAALVDVPAGLPLAGLIFHISRCGSTLVARMLGRARRNLVASEPQIVDQILRLKERDPAPADAQRIAWLRGAVRALGQPPRDGGAERLFIKLDCWHIFSLELFRRAFPGVPLFFVYRHPLEVLVSLMRQPSLTLVRGFVAPAEIGLAADTSAALSRAEHAAAILGAFFRAAAKSRADLIPIAYESLPGGLAAVSPVDFFTAGERRSFLAAAVENAKQPGRLFEPDGSRKQAEASDEFQAAVACYAEPAYARWLAVAGPPPAPAQPPPLGPK